MAHMETVQNIWIIIIIILLTAIAYSLIDLKSEWERFTLQDGRDLYKHFHLDEHPIPDFLNR